jgi:hypothetical protein
MPTRDGGSGGSKRGHVAETSPARQGDGPTITLPPGAAGVFKSATIRATAATLMGLEILAQDRSHFRWWVSTPRAETALNAPETGAGAIWALGTREPRQCPS